MKIGFVSEKRKRKERKETNFLRTTLWRNRSWPVDFAALVEVEEACQGSAEYHTRVRPVVLSTVDYKSVIFEYHPGLLSLEQGLTFIYSLPDEKKKYERRE